MTRTPVPRRPMTEDELRMARAVTPGRVSYVPGSSDKRFAGQICGATDITEGQASYLHRLVYRYRRQIHPAVVALADRSLANARPRSKATGPKATPPTVAPAAADNSQLALEVQS